VLGVALLNINLGHNFLQSALYGFAAAVGFSLVMVLFASFANVWWSPMCLRRFAVMPLPWLPPV
jgi:Na+-translocating ferredoxin:NAD+ oxidoreductase RnfA subunit